MHIHPTYCRCLLTLLLWLSATASWAASVTGATDRSVTVTQLEPDTIGITFTGTGLKTRSALSATASGVGFSVNTPDWYTDSPTGTGTAREVFFVYTPQNVHGQHIGYVTLSSTDGTSATATITVAEDLTPSFSLPSDLDMGSANLGNHTDATLSPTSLSYIAALPSANGMSWTAAISGADAAWFAVSVRDSGYCDIVYSPLSAGSHSATLTLTATYTDAAGQLLTCVQSCALSATALAVKSVNTLAFALSDIFTDSYGIVPFTGLCNPEPITITLSGATGVLQVDNNATLSPTLSATGTGATGTVHVLAEQPESDYYLAASIETDIEVRKHSPQVEWQWQKFYWGGAYSAPYTLTNADQLQTPSLQLTSDPNASVSFDPATLTAVVSAGELVDTVSWTFSLPATISHYGIDTLFRTAISADPRHLPVSLTDQEVYGAVVVNAGNDVSFQGGTFSFAYSARPRDPNRCVTLSYVGVPDQLRFTPTGTNTWMIEESADGISWATTFYPSSLPEGQLFSFSLMPSTRYIRISYGSLTTASDGSLSGVSVSELVGVKASDSEIYMPLVAGVASPVLISLTCANQGALSLSLSDPSFTVSQSQLPATGTDNYTVTSLTLSSSSTTEQTATLSVVDAVGNTLLELPIHTYTFPQSLPIHTASDPAYRYHYVVSASSLTSWDASSRTIVMNNAAPSASRSLTVAFADLPSLCSFSYLADRTDWVGTWTLEESSDATSWTTVATFAQQPYLGTLSHSQWTSTTRYIRLTCVSSATCRVTVSSLDIVGSSDVRLTPATLSFTGNQASTTSISAEVVNATAIVITSSNPHFLVSDASHSASQTLTLTSSDYPAVLGRNLTGTIPLTVTWSGEAAMDEATLTVTDRTTGAVLATASLTGEWGAISFAQASHTGIYTGLASGYTASGFVGTTRREVDLSAAFSSLGSPLFDRLYVFAETFTTDGASRISSPTATAGSNALTPCYIYDRSGSMYVLTSKVENANSRTKVTPGAIEIDGTLSVYLTGFCPYASTGYTKDEEGVFFFRGEAGEQVDVYLDDAYLYSRNKSENGRSISKGNGPTFSEGYVRGSGGVLVFECSDHQNSANPFRAFIHMRRSNRLTSNYGCFYASPVGEAYQVSSPVQVHLASDQRIHSYTTVTLDDCWPDQNGTARTGGALSLRKLANNCPSIDLGNAHTVVNFRGGQVELQNAQIVSPNYKTTLAISYRSGRMAEFMMAYGIGTDDAGGTVNFYDGTTTVIPMTVAADYRPYYLMDEDANGNELSTTSCLRCPDNTFVYGGSHCFMRACSDVTSRGGAPHDAAGSALGQYDYTLQTGDVVDPLTGLATLDAAHFPAGIASDDDPSYTLLDYYTDHSIPVYSTQSVTPDGGHLYFWIPEGFGEVEAEVDRQIEYWKACMTTIEASYGQYGGSIGGNTTFEDDTQVENFLYCVMDNQIRSVISDPSYAAPVKNPAGSDYLSIHPTSVGSSNQYFVTNATSYTVNSSLYYVATIPSADQWMTFTAPFDVKHIYVAETYSEDVLAAGASRAAIITEQARHNADMAAFFGVAMVLGSNKSFDNIFADYLTWAKQEDQALGYYSGTGAYTVRGKHEIDYLRSSNWMTANYYLYENTTSWTVADDETLTTSWRVPARDANTGVLLHQGSSYSFFFPYCPGCDVRHDANGDPMTDINGDLLKNERDYWDYWTGKFLIFEGDGPQTLYGSNYLDYVMAQVPNSGEVIVTGNPTFAPLTQMPSEDAVDVFRFSADMANESFWIDEFDDDQLVGLPTETFLLGVLPANAQQAPARRINMQTGHITYGPVPSGFDQHVPTIASGSILVTAADDVVQIEVSAPQTLRLFSSDGRLLFSGYVDSSVSVSLAPGIYVVQGPSSAEKFIVY